MFKSMHSGDMIIARVYNGKVERRFADELKGRFLQHSRDFRTLEQYKKHLNNVGYKEVEIYYYV